MVSLVRLMLFTTTVEILTVRTGSVQSCHQTPIFPYRGRARQTQVDPGVLPKHLARTACRSTFPGPLVDSLKLKACSASAVS